MASSSKLPKPDILSPLKTPIEQPPPPPPTTVTTTTTTTRKRKLESITNPSEILTPSSIEDQSLSSSSHLTHQELIRRRLHRLNQLSKVYKDHYWALMEDLRVQYRDYYWKYGVSPCKDDEERERESGNCDKGDFGAFHAEGCGETNHQNQSNNNNNNHNQTHVNNNNNGGVVVVGGVGNSGGNLGLGFGEEVKLGGNNRCAFVVCKLKAMAMTSFCYLHILSDPNQKLYKACTYMIKFAQQGPILCGRPILKSTVPALCNIHFPKAQKDVKHALKKAGLNVSSSAKLAPKFHVLVAEYVHHIQSKRRATQKLNSKSIVIKEETS